MLCEAGQQFEHLGRVERRNKLGTLPRHACTGYRRIRGITYPPFRQSVKVRLPISHGLPRAWCGCFRDLAEIIESHFSSPPLLTLSTPSASLPQTMQIFTPPQRATFSGRGPLRAIHGIGCPWEVQPFLTIIVLFLSQRYGRR